MFVLFVATLAAAHAATGPPCAVVSRHKLLTGKTVDCCESCSLGWIRSTTWVTSSVTLTSSDSDTETLNYRSIGSGDLTFEHSDTKTEIVSSAEAHTLTRPCGECITFDDCLDHGGHANMWHRTCTRLRD